MSITIRPELPADIAAITALTEAAFREAPHTSHREHFIVDALRRAGALQVSLVAVTDGLIVGHVALSPVAISSGAQQWYGLGPISVSPAHQNQGIGSALMKAALAQLREVGGHGCVLVGEPAYYSRFGFVPHAPLVLPEVPAKYFQAMLLAGDMPAGEVTFHTAFNAVH
jgi:predicted N-acetyltransferase YhbS